jgi:lysophospholipase
MTSDANPRRRLPEGARISRWSAADGWPLRLLEWEAAVERPRGTILFQGGRGDMLEKYLESFGRWHAEGWTVGGFDWRGQGGSGRLNPARPCGHIQDFAAFVADLRGFWSDWVARTPGPHVVIGHSMGGHLILRAMVEGAIAPATAVLVAPMLGLRAPISAAVGEGYARLIASIGDDSRPAWKTNEKPYTLTARRKLLTHDEARYADELWWHKHDPALFTGPPSWRWLAQAFESTRALGKDPRLATLDTPVLMLVAEADQLVDPAAALAVAARLPRAKVVRFGAESAHEILREADPVRERALAEIDAFLQAHA